MSVVRAWVADNYPGCKLEYVTIHCRRLAKPIRLAAGPETTGHRSPDETIGQDEPDERRKLPDAVRDILRVLREAKRPLTLTEMMEQMQRRNMEPWSDRTLMRHLAKLMADGTVENPEDARPRGYRLVSPDNPDSD